MKGLFILGFSLINLAANNLSVLAENRQPTNVEINIATVDAPVIVKTKDANGSVNLREEPNTKSRIIAPVPNGTRLAICTQCEDKQIFQDKYGHTWYRVFWDSRKLSGWINARYLFLPKKSIKIKFDELQSTVFTYYSLSK